MVRKVRERRRRRRWGHDHLRREGGGADLIAEGPDFWPEIGTVEACNGNQCDPQCEKNPCAAAGGFVEKDHSGEAREHEAERDKFDPGESIENIAKDFTPDLFGHVEWGEGILGMESRCYAAGGFQKRRARQWPRW